MGMIPIAYRDINFLWVSSHYDFHHEGICTHDGKVARFACSEDYPENWGTCEHDDGSDCPLCDNPPIVCNVFPLTALGRLKWLIRKRMFELCVGEHWTYPNRRNGASFRTRRPRWLYALLFAAYYRKWRSAWMVFYVWPRARRS
jgi:hypothetical protein